MKKISLYFKEGSSDKEYHIQMVESGTGFVVNFQYGRVGNALQTGTKTPAPVSEKDAEKIFNKLIKEKEAKGYLASEDSNKVAFSEASVKKETFDVFPQLLNTVEDAQQFIDDDSYLAQEKMDGERRMVMSDADIKGLNKKGQSVQLPICIETSIYNTGILDGEIVGEKLYVFDVLSFKGKNLKDLTCVERLKVLSTIEFGKSIEIVKTAYTREEKQKMYDELIAGNKEGIVFKKKNSLYRAGRPASGGDQLKFKFYKTATFIVKDFTKNKRSVGLELLDGAERIGVGKVTIPPNKNIPAIGKLVEVRYLYAYRDGAIFQPVFLNERNDVDTEECVMAQLVYKQDNEE